MRGYEEKRANFNFMPTFLESASSCKTSDSTTDDEDMKLNIRCNRHNGNCTLLVEGVYQLGTETR